MSGERPWIAGNLRIDRGVLDAIQALVRKLTAR